jgi:thiamine biosynthesis protein ThiS
VKISIELYASLMKYLPPGKSRFRRDIEVDEGQTLSRLIEQFHIQPEEAHLVLINGRYVNADERDGRELAEGDVVSIWPPVAGG